MTGEQRYPFDLHLHSTFSDGLKTPSELCEMAVKSGVTLLSLSDHDTAEGVAPMAEAAGGRVRFLPAVELSSGPDGRIHVLGYGASAQNEALARHFCRMAASRRERMAKMLARLREMGIPIAPEALPESTSPGRAHVARALVRAGVVSDVEQAFERYLRPGGPAYVSRDFLSAGEAVQLLREAGCVPVLAHPVLLKLTPPTLHALVRELKGRGLRGVEAYHPSAGAGNARALALMARAARPLVTGGSDYHGDPHAANAMGVMPAGWQTANEDAQALWNAASKETR